jgi:hypothetical protein
MIIISYKYSKKGGISKFFKEVIVILRIFNLQQSLVLRARIVDITLNTRLGGDRTDGRKSVDSLGGNKSKGRKSDKKSFDFNKIVKRNIPILNNS